MTTEATPTVCYRLHVLHRARFPLPAAEGFDLREDVMGGCPPGSRLLLAEVGGCACALVARESGDRAEQERARRGKQGWSRAKIERAIEARGASRARGDRGRRAFEAWLDAAVTSVPGMRVLVSEYGDPVPTVAEVRIVVPAAFVQAPLEHRGVWVKFASVAEKGMESEGA
ncbi:MAG: hypothetical protein V4850_20550 [Myxococcota bacterium]